MRKPVITILAATTLITGVSAGAALAQPKPCPPGLAKRDNGCLPPGLAKRYVVGQPLPEGLTYELITDLARYGLTPPDGEWLYYLVDGEVLKIADATFVVLDALGLLGN